MMMMKCLTMSKRPPLPLPAMVQMLKAISLATTMRQHFFNAPHYMLAPNVLVHAADACRSTSQ